MKKNCWEVKGCGREPGGSKAGELGVCSATTNGRLNGVHSGKNAGRSCWVVAGTLCGGTVQGTFAQKFSTCEVCEFYTSVKSEETPSFILSATLLSKLR
ncbi:MAG: hypothetical protein Q8J64_06730 [Thermodesulfovibrionales bacterium]|nr:hypothetical protein [Thermodesulfovibrionales bacterium]